MRWVFAVLVLANLGLWMWASWYKEPARPMQSAPRADVNAAKLKRLDEPGVRLVPRSERREVETLAPATPKSCYRIGPFAQPEHAAQAGQRLAALGVTFESRAETHETVTSWRVYLPPFPSRAAAEAKRSELTGLGFRDHAVLEEPGLENAVSLGLFKVETNAHHHLERLAAKGIHAKLQTLTRTRVVHWLWLPGGIPAERRKALYQESWGKDARLQEAPCLPSQEPIGTLPGPNRYIYNASSFTGPA